MNSKKKIGLFGCLTLGVGCIIGSGIFGSLPEVINQIGAGIVPALIVAALVVIMRVIPGTMSASVVPVSGHYFMHQTKLIHPIMGIVEVGNTILLSSMLALYGVLFAEYFLVLFPSCPLSDLAVGCIFVTIFCGLELLGNKISSDVQNVLVILLAAALVMYSVLGIFSIETSQITFMDIIKPGVSLTSFSAAVGVLTSSMSGGGACMEVADDVRKPRRNVPLAMILSPAIVCVIYVMMAVVTVSMGTGNLESLADIAGKFMSPSLLIGFIVFGPVMGIVTSFIPFLLMNIANLDFMARERVLPDFFGKRNRYNIAWVCVLFSWALTILIIITGQTFGIIMVIFSFANVMEEGPLTLIPLIIRKKYPKSVAATPQLFNRYLIYILSIVSFCISVYLGVQLFISMNTAAWVGVVATYGLLFIYAGLRIVYLKKKENYDLLKEMAKPYEPWEEYERSLE